MREKMPRKYQIMNFILVRYVFNRNLVNTIECQWNFAWILYRHNINTTTERKTEMVITVYGYTQRSYYMHRLMANEKFVRGTLSKKKKKQQQRNAGFLSRNAYKIYACGAHTAHNWIVLMVDLSNCNGVIEASICNIKVCSTPRAASKIKIKLKWTAVRTRLFFLLFFGDILHLSMLVGVKMDWLNVDPLAMATQEMFNAIWFGLCAKCVHDYIDGLLQWRRRRKNIVSSQIYKYARAC